MTAAQFGAGGAGRPLKGGVHRRVVQARMPTYLFDALMRTAEEMDLTLSDLGAYHLIRGWNLTRAELGMDAIPMPAYLEAAVRAAAEGETQDVLEESLLKVS